MASKFLNFNEDNKTEVLLFGLSADCSTATDLGSFEYLT